jgi:hypothetical protein
MANFLELPFIAFSTIDPLILVAPICFCLSALVIAALWQLEQTRFRLQHQSRTQKRLRRSQAAFRKPWDRQD